MASEMLNAILEAEKSAQESENKAKSDAEVYIQQMKANALAEAKAIIAEAEAKANMIIEKAEKLAKDAEESSIKAGNEECLKLKENAGSRQSEAIRAVINSL